MLLTPHTFVGIAIAHAIPNPIIAVPLAFGMHFLGDLVPHWDFYSGTSMEERRVGWRPMAVMADLSIAVALGVFATTHAMWVVNSNTLALNVFLCAIASSMPDAISSLKIFTTKEPWLVRTVYRIQHHLQFQAPLPWGVITQLLVVFASSLLILNSTL